MMSLPALFRPLVRRTPALLAASVAGPARSFASSPLRSDDFDGRKKPYMAEIIDTLESSENALPEQHHFGASRRLEGDRAGRPRREWIGHLIANQPIRPEDFGERAAQSQGPRAKRAYLGPSAAESRKNDAFYQLGIDPLRESKNIALLTHFMTGMAKIRGRSETRLTWRTQRRIAKAIRRAKMMGLMPILSKGKTSMRPNPGDLYRVPAEGDDL